jgi:hypothetical protein
MTNRHGADGSKPVRVREDDEEKAAMDYKGSQC